LRWKHNFKRWSKFSWNKSRSTYSSCCFFNHFSSQHPIAESVWVNNINHSSTAA